MGRGWLAIAKQKNREHCAWISGKRLQDGKSACFFVVWSFLLFGLYGCVFFAVWAGACFFFAVWAGAQAPPKQQTKKHAPAQTAKKTRHRPFRACFFFAVWAGGCVYFFAVWAGGVLFFAVWAGGRVLFFCCLGGGVFFFLLFGRGRLFLLFGPGACCFFAVWAGDGSSLTYPSAWLVFKPPNNKRDRTAKKKHGFRLQDIRSTWAGWIYIRFEVLANLCMSQSSKAWQV